MIEKKFLLYPFQSTENFFLLLQSVLLLNMIRTLTTSSSEDQKELDRKRLEVGFAETSKEIDHLVLGEQCGGNSSCDKL